MQGAPSRSLPHTATDPRTHFERLEERRLMDGDGARDHTDDHANWSQWDEATVISLNSLGFGSASGELEVQGDSDLFSFTASRAGAAQLRLETGAGFDGKLWAYGGDHEFLKVRNERGPGGDELLEFEVDAGETYFVMIDGWRVPNGDYTVVVDSIDDHADFGAWRAAQAIPLDSLGFGGHPGVIEENGDSDLFSFVATRSGTAQLRLDVADTFDGRVWVYDAAHEFLKVRNSGGAGADETLEVAVVDGTKYFVLVDGSRAPGGAYMLRVEAVDDHADYGHWAFATPFSLDSAHAGSAPGTLESNADSDLFTFEATRTGTAELRLDVAANFDGKLWVYDDQHEFLKVRNERGPGGDETIQVGVQQGVTYFLVVTGWRRPSGGYTVLVETIDDHADAGAWAAATGIPLDGSGNGARAGVLELARDTDLFRFVAPGAGLVSITLDVVAGFDGWLEIYDSGRNLVEPRRNARPTGGDETLAFTAAAGETYFILVGGWRNPNGDYNLLVNA